MPNSRSNYLAMKEINRQNADPRTAPMPEIPEPTYIVSEQDIETMRGEPRATQHGESFGLWLYRLFIICALAGSVIFLILNFLILKT